MLYKLSFLQTISELPPLIYYWKHSSPAGCISPSEASPSSEHQRIPPHGKHTAGHTLPLDSIIQLLAPEQPEHKLVPLLGIHGEGAGALHCQRATAQQLLVQHLPKHLPSHQVGCNNPPLDNPPFCLYLSPKSFNKSSSCFLMNVR